MPILTRRRRCGAELEPDRRAPAAGVWRLCPECRDENRSADPGARCGACGRPPKAGKRPARARCIGVPA